MSYDREEDDYLDEWAEEERALLVEEEPLDDDEQAYIERYADYENDLAVEVPEALPVDPQEGQEQPPPVEPPPFIWTRRKVQDAMQELDQLHRVDKYNSFFAHVAREAKRFKRMPRTYRFQTATPNRQEKRAEVKRWKQAHKNIHARKNYSRFERSQARKRKISAAQYVHRDRLNNVIQKEYNALAYNNLGGKQLPLYERKRTVHAKTLNTDNSLEGFDAFKNKVYHRHLYNRAQRIVDAKYPKYDRKTGRRNVIDPNVRRGRINAEYERLQSQISQGNEKYFSPITRHRKPSKINGVVIEGNFGQRLKIVARESAKEKAGEIIDRIKPRRPSPMATVEKTPTTHAVNYNHAPTKEKWREDRAPASLPSNMSGKDQDEGLVIDDEDDFSTGDEDAAEEIDDEEDAADQVDDEEEDDEIENRRGFFARFFNRG